MQYNKRQTRSLQTTLVAEPFLRSINIAFDANQPERISHFRPTSKCVPLVRALLGMNSERAFFLVAPYGSGKSLTATYALHLVENNQSSGQIRLEINKRLEVVSPELASFAKTRRASSTKKGLALALHGHVSNVPEQLKLAACESLKRVGLRRWKTLASFESKDVVGVLAKIHEICQQENCDLTTIVWDEFGRHIEAIVALGRGDELSEIQTIAEVASRSQKIPLTFCAILHQGLLHYATGLPQAIRADWKKIEGRFETIQYVDDSKEIYRLIGEVVSARGEGTQAANALRNKSKQCHDLGLFSEFKPRELGELLRAAYPLEPAALYLLPRIAARVAQNERTLFSFLYNADLSRLCTVADLYDYFSTSMRADTAVGGTHRQWLETESAISKLPSGDRGIDALKAACLLGFGTSGERSRTSLELLEFAIAGYSNSDQLIVLSQLINRKLLLHRKHNDDVSVWHGTDLDLRGRLADEREKLEGTFDLESFLTKEVPPPVWKPVEHNDTHCVRRFLPGVYMTRNLMESISSWAISDVPKDADGRIVYVLANDHDELKAAEKLTKKVADDELVIVAIPSEPIPLHDAAIEVAALQRMQRDQDLIESDPIALAELQQMTDDAFEHLQRLVDRLVKPSSSGLRWFSMGKSATPANDRDLRSWLSKIMDQVFHETPLLNNELINRKKPSPALVNSRKKLEMAILERHGRPQLGIEGFFPDKSMFNSILLHTGLYRQERNSERWGYAHASTLKDPGLKAVWQIFQQFLTTPSDKPTSFSKLFYKLQSPPYGMRLGVLPILVAAALRAFPSAISLMHRGQYLNDVLPSDIENICRFSEEYEIVVLDIDATRQKYLRRFHKHLSVSANYEIEENDLIRLTFDALEAWKHQLPPAAFTTAQLTTMTLAFRLAIQRIGDPVQLFFTELPRVVGVSIDKPLKLVEALQACCKELEDVALGYSERARTVVLNALRVNGRDDSNKSLRQIAKQWADFFPDQFVEKLSDGIAKGLISRLTIDYDSDALFIDSIASLLVKKSVRRWDDSMVATFDREFSNYVTKIENSARSYPAPTDELRKGLSQLVFGRMTEMFTQLEALIGLSQAAEMLNRLQSGKEAVINGNND